MKTLIVIIITFFGIQIFMPSDYRDSYTGNYVCKKICKRLNFNNKIVYDTINYTLPVSKSLTDSMIILETSEGSFTVKLSNNTFRSPTTKCFGSFSGDSIYARFIPSLGPTAYRYFGKK